MYKPNIMIRIYDYKRNKIYMINTTTKKIYYHPQKLRNVSTMVIFIFYMMFTRIEDWLRPQLYLYNPNQNIKIFLIIVGVLTGFLLAWLLKKKRYEPQLEEYLREYHYAKEVENADEIKQIVNKFSLQAIGLIFGGFVVLAASILIFNRFLNDGNLGTYIRSMMFFLIFSFILTRIDHIVFILKLDAEMNPSVDDIPVPKKHPWEEKQDENEIWKAKMLKLESEINANKE